MRTGVRLALGLLAALLLMVLVRGLAGGGAARPAGDGLGGARLVEADTLPDTDAVGLCAVSRESGTVEGRIIGITASPANESPRYRVQNLANPAVEHVVAPVAIRIVSCEALPPGASAPAAPPGRAP